MQLMKRVSCHCVFVFGERVCVCVFSISELKEWNKYQTVVHQNEQCWRQFGSEAVHFYG